MRYLKMLGLLAIAASSLMAFAGTASADRITSSTGETPLIKAVNEGHLTLHGPVGEITCSGSEVEGTVTGHGGGKPVSGPVSKLTLTGCGSTHYTVIKGGTFSITNHNATGNGTLTSTGAEITTVQTTIFGTIHCIYATNNTPIGTLTTHVGANSQHATLHIQAEIPRVPTSGLCGSEPQIWTGSYTVTHPLNLTVDKTTPPEITSSTGETPTIRAHNETLNGSNHLVLHGPLGEITCEKSEVEGSVTGHGAGAPASGPISKLTFTGCGTSHVTVVKGGTFSIKNANATGSSTLTSSGAEVTVIQTTIFGPVHCIYATNNTPIGTLTSHVGSSNQHATLDIEAHIPRVATSGLCGSEPTEWTGNYTVTHPLNLTVDKT